MANGFGIEPQRYWHHRDDNALDLAQRISAAATMVRRALAECPRVADRLAEIADELEERAAEVLSLDRDERDFDAEFDALRQSVDARSALAREKAA